GWKDSPDEPADGCGRGIDRPPRRRAGADVVEPVKRVAGRMAPLDLADVDTDQIIPKQFLKRIERTEYGPFLFYDWRARDNFVLDRPEYAGASVLGAGANFGCRPPREHAARALRDVGFKGIVALAFGDIFLATS